MKDESLTYQAVTKVDFGSVIGPREIMRPIGYDVPEIHGEVRNLFAEKIALVSDKNCRENPPILPILGQGGSGKTFLLSDLYGKTNMNNGFFAAFELPSGPDVYEKINFDLINCLLNHVDEGIPQITPVVLNILKLMPQARGISGPEKFHKDIQGMEIENFNKIIKNFLNWFFNEYPGDAANCVDIVKCLFYLAKGDWKTGSLAFSWLTNTSDEDYVNSKLALSANKIEPKDIFYRINRLMSMSGTFSVFAVDQLDIILKVEYDREKSAIRIKNPGQNKANVLKFLEFLTDLKNNTSRTFSVIASIHDIWNLIGKYHDNVKNGIFDREVVLRPVTDPALVEKIVFKRLGETYAKEEFVPDYPTYPFPKPFFEKMAGSYPREILKACAKHIERCVIRSEISEWGDDGDQRPALVKAPELPPTVDPSTDERFLRATGLADVPAIKNLNEEHGYWQKILDALAAFVTAEERDLPENRDLIHLRAFGGIKKQPYPN
ncbi:MAG: hypothetical protein LBF41_07015, partial [Deltaproteobacteria bacterium]|nr:hypothetical protein [Deltaproteobacteria bacterium]